VALEAVEIYIDDNVAKTRKLWKAKQIGERPAKAHKGKEMITVRSSLE
jgi:hypothetical protein